MLRITVFYHLALLPAVVLLLDYFRRRTTAAAFFHGAAAGLASAMLLAFLIGDTNCTFAVPVGGRLNLTPLTSNLRLFTQGFFIEGTLFILGAAIFAFRAGKKRLGIFAGCAAILLAAVGVDAMIVEPTALVVRRTRIASDKISRPVRILFASDIQTDTLDDYSRRAFARMKEENADLILLGGDYLQYSRSSAVTEPPFWPNFRRQAGLARNLGEEFNRLLKEEKLSAPLGVYAVAGFPHEDRLAADWFALTGVTFVAHDGVVRLSDELSLICLTAAGSRAASTPGFVFPKVEKSAGGKEPFTLMLGHVPSFALGRPNADLLLAGHTHGGQVRLPFFGPIFTMTPGLPRSMASGISTFTAADGRTGTLIVSNGVGMERAFAPKVRFLCRPDFWVVDLVPKK